MAKRTDTNIAILVQVMSDLGFDHETIGKVTGVPLRTINDLANRRGYWAYTAEFNELRDAYKIHLRKFILGWKCDRFPVNQVVGWLETQSGNKFSNRKTSGAEQPSAAASMN